MRILPLFSIVFIFLLGCTTSTKFIVHPSSAYLLKATDNILVAEMENISPYASEQLLVNAFTNNKECNANYSYAIHDEKNLLQWDISMPIFDDVNINVFKKLIKHTSYNYLLITKLIYAKSGELVYEGKSQGYVDYRAEKVTIGIKMYELKTGFLVEDFLVTSTRKPIEHKDNVGEIHKIPTFLKSPISRAVNKGFNKIANHSKCE